MKFLLTSFFTLLVVIVFAQPQKGDWLIRGTGTTLNQAREGYQTKSEFNFNIALGYFLQDRWMIGGGINLNLDDIRSKVGNQLSARRYFKDSLKNGKFYTELRWETEEYNRVRVGAGNLRFVNTSTILGVGLDYFLSDNLAIETQLDYYFLNKRKRKGEPVLLMNEYLTLNMKLQYFFRYKDYKKEQLIDYRDVLKKGRWFIGGEAVLNKVEIFGELYNQRIRPNVGYVIQKNWIVGSTLLFKSTITYQKINIGLYPFSRYYINLNRKKKIFAELKTGYELNFIKSSQGTEKFKLFSYGGTIGLSNFISNEVSFDIGYSYSNTIFFQESISDNLSRIIDTGLTLGLHYFFTKR